MNIIKGTSHLLHCKIKPSNGVDGFFCTFIYAFNERDNIEELWQDMRMLYTQN